MASILPIKGRWRAQVRRKGHTLARTFDSKREAEAWARDVESGIDQGRRVALTDAVTVGHLITEFRRIRLEARRPVQPETNTHYMLEHLAEDIGQERVADLTPTRLAAWARYRHEQGAGGYTVNMELSQLGTVIRHTASFLGLRLADVVGNARPQLHYLQLISGGKRRTRRPTEDELARLVDGLEERDPRKADAIRVAAITGLRRGELARILWTDLDRKGRAVLVRARKHPRRVEARDEWVPLLGEAWSIVQRQPRTDERIFPVSREALTDSVTEVTRSLGIPDLHLHDLRREATSRLRELGFDQHERKAVTGHRSDEAHDIYVAVKPESLHAKFDAAQDTQRRRQRRRKGRARRPRST
jgi:integrase